MGNSNSYYWKRAQKRKGEKVLGIVVEMRWWEELQIMNKKLSNLKTSISESAVIEELVDIKGAVKIGEGTRVCRGACIRGPVVIGRNCMIGNNSFLRGPIMIGDNVRIGFSTEIKNAIIEDDVIIGPLCFIADSVVRRRAFIAALVRTSNVMLTRETVKVLEDGKLMDTGLERLGAHIMEEVSLGIGVIILPGRVIAPKTVIGPGIIVVKNLEPGIYILKQNLSKKE